MEDNFSSVQWCAECVYPSSSAVPLSFDDDGVCSGCRVHRQKQRINWDQRLQLLLDDIDEYRRPSGYECVIGVSGGKDSYYQVHFVKEKLGLNPLLVTYNGNNFLPDGWENLMRMREIFKVDHVIVSPSVDMLIRLNRLGFVKCGDMNWQNHCGIFTQPMKIACEMNIPLVFWGEHGWTELGGMFSMNDFPEYTARYRLDQNLRGFDWYDFIDDPDEPISASEMNCFKYPSDEDVKRVGLRGLYIGMYDKWDANEHTSLVMERYGWKPASVPFERTYRTFSNLDDRYENGVHDYMKWIKFGYGRATDHASKDIRNGHMTREQGVEMVRKFDHIRSSDLYYWLDYVSRTEEWFDKIADSYRSPSVWWQSDGGDWIKRNIWD